MSRDISKPGAGTRPGKAAPTPKTGPKAVSASRTSPAGTPSPAARPAPAQVDARKAPAPAMNTGVTTNNTGRVKFDDRGNAIWEWAVTTGSFGSSASSKRLQKLDSQLSLADEPPPKRSEVVQENTKGMVQGYSPYDSGQLVKEPAPVRKRTDLRRLSEWMKLRNQFNQNKAARDKDDE